MRECMYTHIQTHMHAYTHEYAQSHGKICVQERMCTYTYMGAKAYIHTDIHACVQTLLHTYTRTYTHTNVHAYKQNPHIKVWPYVSCVLRIRACAKCYCATSVPASHVRQNRTVGAKYAGQSTRLAPSWEPLTRRWLHSRWSDAALDVIQSKPYHTL